MERDKFYFKEKNSVEDYVKEHLCLNAPVLLGLKPAAIFTVSKAEKARLEELLSSCGKKRGGNCPLEEYCGGARMEEETFPSDCRVFAIVTLHSGEKESILLYRKDILYAHLADRKVKRFLHSLALGYEEGTDWILHFKKRFLEYKEEGREFPHEIGIFLGYPLWDIRAFMQNPRREAKLTGYWKVYYKVEKAREQFRKYDRCIALLQKRMEEREKGAERKHIASLCENVA